MEMLFIGSLLFNVIMMVVSVYVLYLTIRFLKKGIVFFDKASSKMDSLK